MPTFDLFMVLLRQIPHTVDKKIAARLQCVWPVQVLQDSYFANAHISSNSRWIISGSTRSWLSTWLFIELPEYHRCQVISVGRFEGAGSRLRYLERGCGGHARRCALGLVGMSSFQKVSSLAVIITMGRIICSGEEVLGSWIRLRESGSGFVLPMLCILLHSVCI